MGYTHYWYLKEGIHEDRMQRIADDFKQLLPEFGKRGIKLANEFDEPTNEPEISRESIHFNGVEGEGHETFAIKAGEPAGHKSEHGKWYLKGWYFDCCKTAHKPYDLPVMCALLLLKAHLGDKCEVHTDGGGADWIPALMIIRDAFGYGCGVSCSVDASVRD